MLFTRRRYDPRLGYAGAETALYPQLADDATQQELAPRLDARPPADKPSAIQAEARTVAWQLGAPFFIQVIEGQAGGIAHLVAGPLESSDAGQHLLDARWRVEFDRPADVVIAGISGQRRKTSRSTTSSLALFSPPGRISCPAERQIVVLTEAAPPLGPGFEKFRHHDDPAARPVRPAHAGESERSRRRFHVDQLLPSKRAFIS